MPSLHRFSFGAIGATLVLLAGGLTCVAAILPFVLDEPAPPGHERIALVVASAIAVHPEGAGRVLEAAVEAEPSLAAVCWYGGDGALQQGRARGGAANPCEAIDEAQITVRLRVDPDQPWLGELVLVGASRSPFPVKALIAVLGAILLAAAFAVLARRLLASRLDSIAIGAHRLRAAPATATLDAERGELHDAVRDINAAVVDLRQQLQEAVAARDAARVGQRSATRRLEAFVAGAEDAILTVLADGTVESFNTSAERLFQVKARDVVGTSARRLLPDMFDEDVTQGPRKSKIEIGGGIETFGLRPLGERFPVECSVSLVQDDEQSRLLWIVRDVTERKLQEQNLEQIRAHLEQKVVDRIAALSRTNKQLQSEVVERRRAEEAALAAARAKSQFLATMSHELRTPLNAIIGYAELIDEEAQEAGISAFSSDIEKIRISARHLLSLIRDILEFSSMEMGEAAPHWQEFAVTDFVEQVSSAALSRARATGNNLVTVLGRGLGTVRSDPSRLQLILENLLSNACKFTEHGEITLRVHKVTRPDATWIEFDVQDTGIGIDPSLLHRLFETFTQADQSSTRRYEGAGLGLAIVRRAADLLGAELAATSRLGEGSTFTVRIPLDGERHLASTSRMGADRRASTPRSPS